MLHWPNLQVIVSGLSLSSYYAVLAIGFGVIFSTLRIFHIAHAAVFGTAGYVFYGLVRVAGLDPWTSGAVAIVAAVALGLLIDKTIYIPIERRGGGLFSIFIASLGVALLFEAVALLLTHGVLSIAREGELSPVTIGSVTFRPFDLEVFLAVAALYAGLYIGMMRTRIGLEIRALADNPVMASVVGIGAVRTRNAIFLVASALAGIAGIFTTYDSGIIPTTGLDLLFITTTAVILGGTRHLFLGALGGSLIMGVVTAVTGYEAPQYVTITVFVLLIGLLVSRPSGLFG